MVICCGKEMIEAGEFYHCRKCGKRLVDFSHGKTKGRILELLLLELDGLGISQKRFLGIMRKVWQTATYEDFVGPIDDEWEKS